jgi:glycosyltransferase involved in cell wall biosynthesis
MTRLAEGRVTASDSGAVGGVQWRAERQLAQDAVLPADRVVVSCAAALGAGGLGRHLREIVDALERRSQETVCISGAQPRSHAAQRRLPARAVNSLLSLPPLRLGAAQRALSLNVEFDSDAAGRLPAADHLIAFNGLALEQIRAAEAAGYKSASIVAATSHMRDVIRQYARAYDQYPIEGSWAPRLVKRTLLEYSLADRVYVASEHVRDSFLEAGFDADALALFPLTTDPRYEPSQAQADSTTFDIVYVGAVSVVKGVPLLVDAVRALPHDDIRLRLVGGWTSRGMRRFIQRACAEDSRIQVGNGDPLPHLQAARLYVHPSYSDGFGYAPAEALACGVPVIVSEDTGMKDLLATHPGSGQVVATGERVLLSEAIDAAYRGELFRSPRAG